MRKFGNMETQRAYDRDHQSISKPMNEKEPMGNEADSEHDHMGEEGGHEEIQNVVSEHGPADSHEHTMEGEQHTVVSHHGGHTHTSKGHPSSEHAHAHIGHAMGVQVDNKKKAKSPEEDEAGAAESEDRGSSLMPQMD